MDNTKVNNSCTNAAPSHPAAHTAKLLLVDCFRKPGIAPIQIQKANSSAQSGWEAFVGQTLLANPGLRGSHGR